MWNIFLNALTGATLLSVSWRIITPVLAPEISLSGLLPVSLVTMILASALTYAGERVASGKYKFSKVNLQVITFVWCFWILSALGLWIASQL